MISWQLFLNEILFIIFYLILRQRVSLQTFFKSTHHFLHCKQNIPTVSVQFNVTYLKSAPIKSRGISRLAWCAYLTFLNIQDKSHLSSNHCLCCTCYHHPFSLLRAPPNAQEVQQTCLYLCLVLSSKIESRFPSLNLFPALTYNRTPHNSLSMSLSACNWWPSIQRIHSSFGFILAFIIFKQDKKKRKLSAALYCKEKKT